ncbi:Peptidyl-prolyl cis-trans isomerases isoform 1 [Gossypium australe]|uniref:Peptidyl-prolyl cis-trans isomerases isoform 1 n=1 Tax=Gossypium australe TaxID=47621 RepID=A0A5B6UF07_9ROSI|nr:Peptidyl-prolyl cis-trans isomerases isoform 1 [Gossypium australe]
MGRRLNDPEHSRFASLFLLSVALFSCVLVYAVVSTFLNPNVGSQDSSFESFEMVASGDLGEKKDECCRGIENLELWGPAVKWGSEFKFNSSVECCQACKTMCSGNDGPCLCDTWVFCGNKEACGSRFGECWLKKQKDPLSPDRQDAGKSVIWTSGLIFGKGEGIVGMETEYGTLHIKLFPNCAPHSVAYILELLTMRHCVGCQFYRAESRGQSWDSEGNHIKDAPYGPPFALIQGILEVQGTPFNKMPTEACPTIRRGSVAWIGSGPEFFISLANHREWKNSYTVFGSVLPEDMEVAEKIVQLPTKSDVWNNINVSVLEKPVPLIMRRMKKSLGDLNSNVKSE